MRMGHARRHGGFCARIAWALALIAVSWTGCGAKRPVVTTHPPPTEWPGGISHVIIVSIDGLRVDEIDEENTPVLMKMIGEGAATLAAQTVSPSVTLPAHASMLTGLTPDQHHIKWNTYNPRLGNLQAPTIFDIARENGLTTAVFVGKDKFKHIVQDDDVDLCSIAKRSDHEVMKEAIRYLHSHEPNLMWVHLPSVDRAGHFAGWKSGMQLQVVKEADRLVGSLLDTVEVRDLSGSTVVIVTADHGGQGRHHSGKDTDNRTIPWIVWGEPIAHRTLSPVSITATANTALRLLGLELPKAWLAREAGAAP